MFMKVLIKEKLPLLYKAAADMHTSTVTPARMHELAAQSRKAWSNLLVKLSEWAVMNANSSDVGAHFTREALSAREPILGDDGTTLYFPCPLCPAAAGAGSEGQPLGVQH